MLHERLRPMIPTLVPEPFDSSDHVFELKWDGIRCLTHITAGGELEMLSRNLRSITHQFPEFSGLPVNLDCENAILDGELCVLGEDGHPDFGAISRRIRTRRERSIRRLSGNLPATYIVWDLLYYNNRDLRGLPLLKRREHLDGAVSTGGSSRLYLNPVIPERGRELFREVKNNGLEGMVAKKKDSPYIHGRTGLWVKVKNMKEMSCVIGGLTLPPPSSVLVGAYDSEDRLRYLGRIERGVGTEIRRALLELMPLLGREESPFWNSPPLSGATWIRPVIACRVKYLELTLQGHLREAGFIGPEPDRTPESCRLPD